MFASQTATTARAGPGQGQEQHPGLPEMAGPQHLGRRPLPNRGPERDLRGHRPRTAGRKLLPRAPPSHSGVAAHLSGWPAPAVAIAEHVVGPGTLAARAPLTPPPASATGVPADASRAARAAPGLKKASEDLQSAHRVLPRPTQARKTQEKALFLRSHSLSRYHEGCAV
nr:uncharacterized protein LOC108176315 isoform X2 [Oryctolagus cuniculus]